ncbi:MAG: PIN domain-containing protein [Rhizobiaceae bacterium]|nr:PIN domain-containing protein [Rhizobiaceae bacterium]
MAGVILDTCGLLEIRLREGSEKVEAAVDALDDGALFVSVISFCQIRKGACLLPAGRRRSELEDSLSRLETGLHAQTPAIDLETARVWGELTAAARRKELQAAPADSLIAATALRHDLAVMTRNVRDLEPTGVRIFDPRNDP